MSTETFTPPPGPPPFLSDEEIKILAKQGWLPMPPNPTLISSFATLSKSVAAFLDKPQDEKAATYPQANGTELGYYHIANEKEYVTLRSAVHPETELEKQAAAIWRDTAAVLQRIMVDIARALDGPVDIWDDLLDGCLTLPQRKEDITPSLLRLFRYFPGSGFAGQHVDLGFLTLCVGDGRGLQVLDRNTDEWIDVAGPTVLVGETMRVLTWGMIQAGSTEWWKIRMAEIVLSSHFDALCGMTSIWGILAVRCVIIESFYDRIYNSKFNINATKDVREKQRKNLEAKMIRGNNSAK